MENNKYTVYVIHPISTIMSVMNVLITFKAETLNTFLKEHSVSAEKLDVLIKKKSVI